jgi:hypothetical protein
MLRRARSRIALSVIVVAALATIGGPALASTGSVQEGSTSSAGMPFAAAADATYLVAALNGRNEVPGPAGSPAAGDTNGYAVEVLRITGDQLSFAIKWKGIAPPTAAHIHLGATGTAGAVVVPFFGTALPDTLSAAVGSVTVTEPGLLDSITANPGGYYANVHTAEFAAGAVRGQLHKVTNPVDLNSFVRGGPLTGVLDGAQEVPAGDADGHATAFVRSNGNRVNFALNWNGINAPTGAQIHRGATGANGAEVVPLFSAPAGLPASISGVAGIAGGVDPALAQKINRDPAGFYVNVHNADFGDGAVRGQLTRSGDKAGQFDTSSFIAAVERGQQIYACTRQADGTFAFTQHNVSARLQTGIQHSFVANDVGPPQWVSRDRSSVSGTVVSRTPNGAGNIAELDLTLTQTGTKTGQLAGAVEVERLNTVGGVAPAGACDPVAQPIAMSSYRADYLFLTK